MRYKYREVEALQKAPSVIRRRHRHCGGPVADILFVAPPASRTILTLSDSAFEILPVSVGAAVREGFGDVAYNGATVTVPGPLSTIQRSRDGFGP